MKHIVSLLLTLTLCLAMSSAYAAKARDITSSEDSAHHASHLTLHLQDSTCRVIGNYIKVRSAARNSARVLGHVEQADTFILLDVQNCLAQITVLQSAATSPDSWNGLTGWVTADYVDCSCSDTDYRENRRPSTGALTAGFFPVNMPADWYFSSGAGAWSTTLQLAEDGSFSGYYHDWDGGGNDAYPRGTLEECVFSGRFSQPVRISDHEYMMQVTTLTQEQESGREFVRDEMLVTTTKPHGLSLGSWFVIYLPGTPLERIPPAYSMWAYVAADDWYTRDYALYNMSSAYGFHEDEGS